MTARSSRRPIGTLTSRGRETRGRIVTEAARLMLEHGAVATTLDDVRAAAGVSSSQIYHYFEDKDSLVRAVVEHQTEVIVSVHEAIFANLDSLDGLRAWRNFIVKHQRIVHCKGGCPLGTLGSEMAEIDPIARGIAAEGFKRWEQAIRGGYRAMQVRGALRGDVDAERLATATLAALQGGLLLTQMERRTTPLEAALDVVLDHVATLVVEPRSEPDAGGIDWSR